MKIKLCLSCLESNWRQNSRAPPLQGTKREVYKVRTPQWQEGGTLRNRPENWVVGLGETTIMRPIALTFQMYSVWPHRAKADT